jgi:hypothetical protein
LVKTGFAKPGTGIVVPVHESQKSNGTDLYISTTGSSLIIRGLTTTEEGVKLDKQTKVSAKEAFQKRGKAKYLTNALVFKLVDIGDSKLNKAYWSTYHCSSILHLKGDTLTSKYCKQRWCIVCSRIRTAQVIKQYLPAFQEWNNKAFVTLTVPNCTADDLKAVIAAMKTAFDRIRKQMDNDWRRGKRKNPLVAVRKLEVTYNPQTKNYHPHFHLIVRDMEVAHDLREKWLGQPLGASWDGQDVRQADNDSCLELCKYFTKLISSHSEERLIHVDPLDTIFKSVAGERVFQAYKVKASKELDDDEANALAAELEIEAVYEWSQVLTDWVNQDTGELLTGYQPDNATRLLAETGVIRSESLEIDEPIPVSSHSLQLHG